MPLPDLSRSIQHQLETLYGVSPGNSAVTTGTSTTADLPNIPAGKVKSVVVTGITGAAIGDSVSLTLPTAAAASGLQIVGCVVDAATTARIQVLNPTNAAVNPATGTFGFTVYDRT